MLIFGFVMTRTLVSQFSTAIMRAMLVCPPTSFPKTMRPHPHYSPTALFLLCSYRRAHFGRETLLFDFQGLGLTLPEGKEILKSVTGQIRGGAVTAIMGPSGAGKTTFLNTLINKVRVDRKMKHYSFLLF
jgi:ABC-type multidrug transport system fused ATPase/permease subunit